jgi:hypothetical protein
MKTKLLITAIYIAIRLLIYYLVDSNIRASVLNIHLLLWLTGAYYLLMKRLKLYLEEVK